MTLSSKPECYATERPGGISAVAVSFESRKPGLLFMVGGVVFPSLVVVLELATQMCAHGFFDPMPTIWHVLLVSFVPFSNLAVWMVCRERTLPHLKLIVLANGAAMGVAAYYTLLFAPLLPAALIAVFAAGLGLLPMAPMFALITAFRGASYLRATFSFTATPRIKGTLRGALVAIVAIIAADLPATVTRVGMHMAASPDTKTATSGIGWLRVIGNRNLMLRSCYQRVGLTTDLVSLVLYGTNPLRPEAARKIYYRVTGVPFNSEPEPDLFRAARGPIWMPYLLRSSFDRDLGSLQVGGRNRNLFLYASRLDGSVDADTALAYIEWTMEFRNDSVRQEEARAQVQLPPGGVVSRLTLWVNGEEREAAFAARDTVRKAYQKVVQTRRDPVLITTKGPDRIQVQCFPVPPRGGTMKVRLGITVPLAILNRERVLLNLPFFLERNFELDGQALHRVWLESRQPLASRLTAYTQERPKQDLFALRGALRDEYLGAPESAVEATRATSLIRSWSEDETTNDGHVIIQNLEERTEVPPEAIALVVDGSQSMAAYAEQIAEALQSLPEGVRFAAFMASDEPEEISAAKTAGSTLDPASVARKLQEHAYRGGCDNVPALSRAWDFASPSKNVAIVWVHGPQPIIMESPEVLRQAWERRPQTCRLYEMQTSAGPNRILEDMDGVQAVERVECISGVKKDLETLFYRWRTPSPRIAAARERVGPEQAESAEKGKKTSSHLTRLWAYDEVRRLLASRKNKAFEEAVKVSSDYQLVTRVTGAVVLENPQQFQEAGLTPVDAAKVPTIPEPETWLLLGVLAVIFVWMTFHRRSRRCHA